jgi:hypothetical protein
MQAGLKDWQESESSVAGELIGKVPVVGGIVQRSNAPETSLHENAAGRIIDGWSLIVSGQAMGDKERERRMGYFTKNSNDSPRLRQAKEQGMAAILAATEQIATGKMSVPENAGAYLDSIANRYNLTAPEVPSGGRRAGDKPSGEPDLSIRPGETVQQWAARVAGRPTTP